MQVFRNLSHTGAAVVALEYPAVNAVPLKLSRCTKPVQAVHQVRLAVDHATPIGDCSPSGPIDPANVSTFAR